MLKYLRIAVTALSLTACVLLIGLWVRSYWWTDTTISQTQIASYRGKLIVAEMFVVHVERPKPLSSPPKYRFGIFSTPDDGHEMSPINPVFTIPYWPLALVLSALAAVPWVRFSLRTLLTATTLIAVALGLIVASS